MLSGLHYNHIEVIRGGSVYPIKQGKQTMGLAFYYKVGEADKERKVFTGKSEEELKEKAVKFLDKLDNECDMAIMTTKIAMEEMNKPKQLTVREVGNEWYKEYSAKMYDEEKPLSFSAVESRGYTLDKIINYMGDELIANVTQDMAKAFIKAYSVKKDGTYYSVSAVDKLQQTFRMIMEYGRSKGYCTQIIEKVALSANLTTADKDTRFLDEDELKIVYNIVERNIRYKTIVLFLVATGLRQEEAFALNVNDFRVRKDGSVDVTINKTNVEVEKNEYAIVNRTKTDGSVRTVNIPYEVYEMIMEYYQYVLDNETEFQSCLRQLNGVEGVIFVNKDMKPLNKRTFQRNFKDYLKRNGKDDLDFETTLHMFRHSYVSLQAEVAKLEDIALAIGDSLATTHKIYRSLSNKSKEKMRNKTSDVMKRITNEK